MDKWKFKSNFNSLKVDIISYEKIFASKFTMNKIIIALTLTTLPVILAGVDLDEESSEYFDEYSWASPYIQPGLSKEDELIRIIQGVSKRPSLISCNEIAARYIYLIPDQYADKQLIKDVGNILSRKKTLQSKVYNIFQELETTINTPEDEDALRPKYLKNILNKYEKIMLINYYNRQRVIPKEQFYFRNQFLNQFLENNNN
ncbi:uncharacterized protein LOC126897636 isoform X2 [Daktulosphaira vitifoliae]|uniref:uncharacterized protein LOC126897636 isoform X2 n=1 Tax=Daktulosphaira vitifoliae TaxID=58002 RepID=UPI0021AA418B|nr:uncharacterized protein LOC126897636 isoform X2 [Daktulosphaira vitifoliae]